MTTANPTKKRALLPENEDLPNKKIKLDDVAGKTWFFV